MDFYPDGGSVQSGCLFGIDARPGGCEKIFCKILRDDYEDDDVQVCAATGGLCSIIITASGSLACSPACPAPAWRSATRNTHPAIR